LVVGQVGQSVCQVSVSQCQLVGQSVGWSVSQPIVRQSAVCLSVSPFVVQLSISCWSVSVSWLVSWSVGQSLSQLSVSQSVSQLVVSWLVVGQSLLTNVSPRVGEGAK
jgi:hypothetical protein